MAIFLVIGGVICLLIVLKTVSSTVNKKMEIAILNKFDKAEIICATPRASFFGVKSKGAMQVRGKGALVLTKNELYFLRAVPEKEYKIPIQKITDVSLPKSFNGKTVFYPLLCVSFVGDTEKDSMAWAIKDPQPWKEVIERQAAQGKALES
jgi:hypothetical protein